MSHEPKIKSDKSKASREFFINKNNILYLVLLAFVIIFLTIILPRWFYVGTSSPDTGNCLANSEYECLYWTYSGVSGNVVLTIGQNTGTRWMAAEIYFVPQGAQVNNSGVPLLLSNGILAGNTLSNGLVSGNMVRVTLPISNPETTPGVVNSGAIWAVYSTSSVEPANYAKMATATFRAV